MKLITKKEERLLPPLYATEYAKDPICHVKLFAPVGHWTWYLMEYDPARKVAFAFVVGHVNELGYVSIAELQSIKVRSGIIVNGEKVTFGLPIERDLYWTPKPLSQVRELHEPLMMRVGEDERS